MTAILIALRDIVLAAALGWIGVTFEVKTERGAPTPTVEKACASGGVCEARRPSFDISACTDRLT